MSNIKFIYFNARGLGDTIRFLLKYGNVDFEDVRIENEDWPAFKPSTPFGTMPMYEENGKLVDQSIAIARYVAKKVNLVGDNDWENLEIDAMADTLTDLRNKVNPLYYETDAEQKEKSRQSILNESLPFCFERFDKIALKNGGYLAANKLTWVDFYLASIVELFEVLLEQKGLLDKYENLTKLKHNIYAIPAIKTFMETRPKTKE